MMVRDFNSPVSIIYRKSRHKIRKDMAYLNDSINLLYLIDIYRTLLSTMCSKVHICFSSVHGTFGKTDPILAHKVDINTFQII